MRRDWRTGVRVLTAVGGAAVAAGVARAEPAIYPPPTPTSTEVYVGTTRVEPAPPADPVYSAADVERAVAAARQEAAAAAREEMAATAQALARSAEVAGRCLTGFTQLARSARTPADPAEPRRLVLMSYTQPAADAGLPVPPPSPAAPQPTVVVVRESAADAARGLTLSAEGLMAVGFGACGLVAGGVALARGGRGRPVPAPEPPPAPPAPPPTPPSTPGVLLMGQYAAGPLPESAEKFDLGPSYQDEQAAKKKQEAARAEGLVGEILSQNLGLLVELEAAEPPAPALPPADDLPLSAAVTVQLPAVVGRDLTATR